MSKRGRPQEKTKTIIERVLDYIPSWLRRWSSTESDQSSNDINSEIDLSPDLIDDDDDDVPQPPSKRRALSKTVPNVTSYNSKIPDVPASTSNRNETDDTDIYTMTNDQHDNLKITSQRRNEVVYNFTEKGDSYDLVNRSDTNISSSPYPSFSIHSFKSSKLATPQKSNDSNVPIWRSKDRLLRSPFYDGNTRYGGKASSDNIKVIKRAHNNNYQSELQTPKRFKTISVRDRVHAQEISTPVISEAAKQILVTLDGISDTAKEISKPSYLMNSPLAFQIDKSRSQLSKDKLASSSSGGKMPNRSIIPITSPPPTKAVTVTQDFPNKVDRVTDNSFSLTANPLLNYNRSTGDSAELAEKVWRDHHRKQQLESPATSSTDANTPLSSSDKRFRNNASTSENHQKSSSRKMKTTRFQTRPRKSTNSDRDNVDTELPDYQLPKVALPLDKGAFPQFSFESKLDDKKTLSSTIQKENNSDMLSQKKDVDFAFKNPKPLSVHPQSSESYKDEDNNYRFTSLKSKPTSSKEMKGMDTSNDTIGGNKVDFPVFGNINPFKEKIEASNKKSPDIKTDASPIKLALSESKELAIQSDTAMPDLWNKSQNQDTWESQSCLIPNKQSENKSVAFQSSKSTPKKVEEIKPLQVLMSDTDDKWECPICLIRNNKSDIKCVACQANKPGSDNQSDSSKTATNLWGSLSVPNNSWECPVCFVRNNETDNQCLACKASKPGDDKGTLIQDKGSDQSKSTLTSGFKFDNKSAGQIGPGGFTFNTKTTENPSDSNSGMFTFSSKPTSESNPSTDSTGFKFTPANNNNDSITTTATNTTTTTFTFGDVNKTNTSSGFKFGASAPTQASDNSSSKLTEVKTDSDTKAPVFTFGSSQPANKIDNSNQANVGGFKFKSGADNSKTTEQDDKTDLSIQSETKSQESHGLEAISDKPSTQQNSFKVSIDRRQPKVVSDTLITPQSTQTVADITTTTTATASGFNLEKAKPFSSANTSQPTIKFPETISQPTIGSSGFTTTSADKSVEKTKSTTFSFGSTNTSVASVAKTDNHGSSLAIDKNQSGNAKLKPTGTFTFGKSANANSTGSNEGFKFGQTLSSSATSIDTTTSTMPTFGQPVTTSSSGLFSFNSATTTSISNPSESKFVFGNAPTNNPVTTVPTTTTTTIASNFSFGQTQSQSESPFTHSTNTGFSFGQPNSIATTDNKNNDNSNNNNKATFGTQPANSNIFTFGQQNNSSTFNNAVGSVGSFGSSNTTPSNDTNKIFGQKPDNSGSGGLTTGGFGQNIAGNKPASGFNFGQPSTTTTTSSSFNRFNFAAQPPQANNPNPTPVFGNVTSNANEQQQPQGFAFGSNNNDTTNNTTNNNAWPNAASGSQSAPAFQFGASGSSSQGAGGGGFNFGATPQASQSGFNFSAPANTSINPSGFNFGGNQNPPTFTFGANSNDNSQGTGATAGRKIRRAIRRKQRP